MPVDLCAAFRLDSANGVAATTAPPLDGMASVEVLQPDRGGARRVAETIGSRVPVRKVLRCVYRCAFEPILHRMRKVSDLSSGFAAPEGRFTVTIDEVAAARVLAAPGRDR